MIEAGPTEFNTEPPGGLDARFCEVMDAAPVMIWVSGQDKLCIWLNEPWLTFTGRSIAQKLGDGWVQGVHLDDFDRCLKTYISYFDAQGIPDAVSAPSPRRRLSLDR
jgi:PAS domain-containing protein